MSKINLIRTKKILNKFKTLKVLILGDIMLDKYLWGQVDRISPEAPVPVVDVKKDTSCLGGAGNVCHNLESLDASPVLIGVVGNDAAGEWIKNNIPDSSGIFTVKNRPTSIKTRVIAHQQQVVRVDQESTHPLPRKIREEIILFIQQEKFDGLIISDYKKGMISQSLMKKILPYLDKKNIPVFADPKVKNISLLSPVTMLTPNHYEAARITHKPCNTDAEIEKAGGKIFSRVSTQYLIIKRGQQGMTYFAKDEPPIHIPTIAKEVYDVTGAGDTVIATAGLALLAGASIKEAAVLANTAASIVIGKIGTATLSLEELLVGVEKNNS